MKERLVSARTAWRVDYKCDEDVQFIMPVERMESKSDSGGIQNGLKEKD